MLPSLPSLRLSEWPLVLIQRQRKFSGDKHNIPVTGRLQRAV